MFGVKKAHIGFCGNADQWANVVAWFASPDKKLPKLKNMELLMLTDTNEIFHATTLRNWLKLDEPFFAIGSGCHLAIAAMATGKSPREAVGIAAKFDTSTGMGCKVYRV
jgi:ATP-dependent protease HslVU (ClpYQ) peptidase subunit